MYLLDTNAWIRLLTGRGPRIAARLARHDPSEIVVSSVVRAELTFGARRSARVAEDLALLAAAFAPFRPLPFDDRAAEEYGCIRLELERAGLPMGPMDLLIAATARAHDAVVVTHHARELTRVAGLRVEDWEAGASTLP